MKRIIIKIILWNINLRRKYKKHSNWRATNNNIIIKDINLSNINKNIYFG